MRFLVFGLSGIEIRLYTCFYTALSSIGRSTAFHTEKLGSIPSWATTLGFSITVVRKILALGLWGFDSLNPNNCIVSEAWLWSV